MSISSSKELSTPFVFLPSHRGKGTLILQDFKKRVGKDHYFKVAIISWWALPPSQPLPGNCQCFLRNGLPGACTCTHTRTCTRTLPGQPRPFLSSRLLFSFGATLCTNQLNQVLLGRASQHHFLLFQLWTPKLLPLPTALLKLFIPGHLQKSTPREEASSLKGTLYHRPSFTQRA